MARFPSLGLSLKQVQDQIDAHAALDTGVHGAGAFRLARTPRPDRFPGHRRTPVYVLYSKLGVSPRAEVLHENGQVYFEPTTASESYDAVALARDGHAYLGTSAGKLRRVRPVDGSLVWDIQAHADELTDIVVDPQSNVYTSSLDQTVRKFGPDGVEDDSWGPFTGFEDEILQLQASGAEPTLQNLFAISKDGTLSRINPFGTQAWSQTPDAAPTGLAILDHSSFVSSARLVITAGTVIEVRDLSTGSLQDASDPIESAYTHIAADESGRFYAGDLTRTLRCWDRDFNQLWTYTLGNTLRDIAVTPQC